MNLAAVTLSRRHHLSVSAYVFYSTLCLQPAVVCLLGPCYYSSHGINSTLICPFMDSGARTVDRSLLFHLARQLVVPGVPSVSVEDFQRPLRGVILLVTLVVGFHFHRLHRQVTTALNGAFLVPGGGCLGRPARDIAIAN